MFKRNAAILAVAGLVLGGGAIAYAEGSPSRPTVSAQASNNSAQGQAHARPRLARRVVHGDLIVRGKDGFQNVTVDRGKLTAKSDDSITIARPDGVNVTLKLTGQTKVRGELEVGKPTVAMSQDGTALRVGQPQQRQPRSAD